MKQIVAYGLLLIFSWVPLAQADELTEYLNDVGERLNEHFPGKIIVSLVRRDEIDRILDGDEPTACSSRKGFPDLSVCVRVIDGDWKTATRVANELLNIRLEQASDGQKLQKETSGKEDAHESSFYISEGKLQWAFGDQHLSFDEACAGALSFLYDLKHSQFSPEQIEAGQDAMMQASLSGFQERFNTTISNYKTLNETFERDFNEMIAARQEIRSNMDHQLSVAEAKMISTFNQKIEEETKSYQQLLEVSKTISNKPTLGDLALQRATRVTNELAAQLKILHQTQQQKALHTKLEELEVEIALLSEAENLPAPMVLYLEQIKAIQAVYESNDFPTEASSTLQSPAESAEGISVRAQLSEIQQARATIPSDQQQAHELIDVAELATKTADTNFYIGEKEVGNYFLSLGQTLLKTATMGVDIALSVLPGIGDARDFYELTTGKDLMRGEEIGVGGRTLAAVGLLIGSGAMYRKVGDTLKSFIKNTDTVGKEALDLAVKKTSELPESFRLSGTQKLLNVLRDANIPLEKRKHLIKSFEFGAIENVITRSDSLVYRWYNDLQDNAAKRFGRFFTFEKILDSNQARKKLSLPPANRAMRLGKFRLKKNAEIFSGPVSPHHGQPGGGIQIFVTGRSVEDVLEFIEDIK